jgi:hypothetical protein
MLRHQQAARATPFVRFFSATFLWLLKLLCSFFIEAAKTSYKAGNVMRNENLKSHKK